ncbi:NERD domain protein [Thermodesulfatator indicus DSM 15286]|uniref:NERD domain protein n=1 Tax=Thermodesulfatator indicus (strain DSM 15286 / JCM 11887 / CIR29812) TaxID=667014 RepID=F8A854_THEID|nr:nuclease-related domain-containing protein [Thermodesulfatator indicus]AEH45053.1 NERD domain protein [Thermodesulfatator indicus DSM 15286]
MIIKRKDSRENDIKKLRKLLSYNISPKQRFLIEREIRAIQKGEQGERDAAYYIDFHYGKSKNWMVIHDLRIEHRGRVAQIDHLLINRIFEIYVLESKNFSYGLRITPSGDFEVYYKGKYFGIPSPIEQNKRHIEVLCELIRDNDLMPKRLGISLKPKFFNYILISPSSIIKRPNNKKFDTSQIIKADQIKKVIENNLDNANNPLFILNISSTETIFNFAQKLVRFHKPVQINWAEKFGITEKQKITEEQKRTKNRYFCAKCRKSISEKEAKFCWNNKERFKGKAYCFNCQQTFNKR